MASLSTAGLLRSRVITSFANEIRDGRGDGDGDESREERKETSSLEELSVVSPGGAVSDDDDDDDDELSAI